MGWGIVGNIGGKFKSGAKKLFKSGKNLLSSIGVNTDEFLEFGGNLLTGGALAQADAVKEAKKARNQAERQYKEQIDAANAAAERVANLEEERKRRLLLMGQQNPQTLLGGYLGIGGPAKVARPTLG